MFLQILYVKYQFAISREKRIYMFIFCFFKNIHLFRALHLFCLSELTLKFDNSAIVYILFVHSCLVSVILQMERQSV